MADVAFGTDSAGSIRVPAACCGIVGLKTTHGLISIEGVYPVEPEHLDTVGPMGKDIASTVQGMDLLQTGFAAKYAAAKAAKPSGRSIRLAASNSKGLIPILMWQLMRQSPRPIPSRATGRQLPRQMGKREERREYSCVGWGVDQRPTTSIRTGSDDSNKA